MTPHYRAVIDIEVCGTIVAYLRLVRPEKRHPAPFSKRPEGHRRRAVRKFVRRNKEALLCPDS